MLVGGSWVSRSAVMEVRDPQDETIVGYVPRATTADVETALCSAARAKQTARNIPSHERASVLERAAEIVKAEAEDFALTIAREGIKTIREARLEVMRCVMTLKLSAAECSRINGETISFDQRPGSERRRGYFFREPVGVVLALTPFNDPLNLVAHKLGPAIAAGNAVILKPHEKTPLSALKLARALERAGLPDGVLQVITGDGREIGTPLVTDERVRMVSFTGGSKVGNLVLSNAGLKKVSLELGSNCPTLVMNDADVSAAVRDCISGAYWAAGQNCLHVQRIYVQKGVYEQFRDAFVEGARSYKLGAKLDPTTDMGCLIDTASADRVRASVRSAWESGATLLNGGDGKGSRVNPTVLEGVTASHPLVTDEIFGPVTVLAGFEDLNEGISRANAPNFGLQAAIFTQDVKTAFEAIERLEAGAVIVNDSSDYRIDAMPFGGIKGSGLGREGIQSAIAEMTEVKVACFNI
ncbi:aldehyde dehydrogenase family protein [Ensifer sp. ENS04]|nr:aldehyde dehydrogenase family protein [Ensifer sp. ENS04]